MRGKPIVINEGDVFGGYTVTRELPKRIYTSRSFTRVMMVRCKCGVEKELSLSSLKLNKHGCPTCMGKHRSTMNARKREPLGMGSIASLRLI